MKQLLLFLTAAVVLLGTTWCGDASANAIAGDASVLIVHGIPGQDLGLDPALPVDISVDGTCLLEGLEFGEIVGPVTIAAGTYNIRIGLADPVTPCGSAAVIDATVSFLPGENATVIAHLAADGSPTASKFINDLSKPTRNKARVIVHHTAAAPEVNVIARRGNSKKDRAALLGLANGEQAAALLLPGKWTVLVRQSGTMALVLRTRIQLKPREIHLVYAVGTPGSGTFTLLTKKLPYVELKPASLIVIHGIPGDDLGLDPDLSVDVSVDGDCTLSGFTFGGMVGPIWIPEGMHHIAISSASPDVPCGEPALLDADIYIGPTENATVIAHLTADGTPTVSKFTNDVSRTMPGRARLVVHHTAAAPAVDVRAQRPWNGPIGLMVTDLENGEKEGSQIRPGGWDVSIAPAGSGVPVFDRFLYLTPYTTHLVYAVGSVDSGTFDLLVKRVRPMRPVWGDDDDD